ncbi:MAG: hypothetical protein ACE5JL_11540, partial [Dehalococcoidia bacterium]
GRVMRTATRVGTGSSTAAIIFVAVIGAFGGALFLIRAIDERWLVIAVLLTAIGGLSTVAFSRWRTGVLLFFVWIAFEDLARKYLDNALIIYAAKDILVLATYAGYLFWLKRRGERLFRNPVLLPILLLFAWAVLQTLNPGIDSPLTPIVGLRMWFLYVPMMYLGYAFLKHDGHLRGFIVVLMVVGSMVGLLGIIQAIVGLEFLNPDELLPNVRLFLVRNFGDPFGSFTVVRPNSTFLDAGRFATYVFGIFYVGLGGLAYFYSVRKRSRTRRLSLPIFACWAIVFAALFISAQRASIVWLILTIPIFFLAWLVAGSRRGVPGFGHRFPLMQVLVLGAVGALVLVLLIPRQLEGVYRFYDETLSPLGTQSELWNRGAWWTGVRYAMDASVLGHGTGMNSLGKQYIFDVNPYDPADPELTRLGGVEGGYAATVWEWGIVGLGLWFLMSGLLLIRMWGRLRDMGRTPYFWFGVSIVSYTFFILFPWFALGFQVYQNYVVQPLLWFLVGLYFKVADIGKSSEVHGQRRLQEVPPSAPVDLQESSAEGGGPGALREP